MVICHDANLKIKPVVIRGWTMNIQTSHFVSKVSAVWLRYTWESIENKTMTRVRCYPSNWQQVEGKTSYKALILLPLYSKTPINNSPKLNLLKSFLKWRTSDLKTFLRNWILTFFYQAMMSELWQWNWFPKSFNIPSPLETWLTVSILSLAFCPVETVPFLTIPWCRT